MVEQMRTNNDCGPVVVAILTNNPYGRVMSLWPGGFQGNASDSFIHHQGILSRLGFGWETKSLSDLRSKMCTPMKTGILLNSKNDPKTWVREDFIYLHWVVLQSYSDSGIFVHWGDGRIRHFTFEELNKHMTNPFSVAYEVVERIDVDLPWYKRLYKRLTSYIGRLWR